jgi:hypothetical protein
LVFDAIFLTSFFGIENAVNSPGSIERIIDWRTK